MIGQGGKQVIVDFSSTTFIDSTTLGVLVGGVKRLRTNDGQLSLVCSDRNITKIFEITGLDRVFAIHATRDEAVSKLDGVSQPTLLTPEPTLNARRLLALAASCSLRSPQSGCGAVKRVTSGDPSHGKKLFLANRARRATRSRTRARRARSGRTSTTRSPPTRRRGSRSRRWRDLVRGQIAYPEPPMPANLWSTGSDADDVAVYIALCAANPTCGVKAADHDARDDDHGLDDDLRGGGSPTALGKQVFTSAGCAGCHTLKDAGATGNVGPNLDQLKPSAATVSHQVQVGGGAMPSFKATLSPAQIAAVAAYVSSVAGK